MNQAYFLKLDHFEGPLDLLLYLIKVNEIDIFNIDIFVLTQQYIEYLRLLEFKDLQQSGEFLEMAATLIEIKSKLLLPTEKVADGDSDLEEEDPMQSLQRRLIEYEKIKKAAEFFADRYSNSHEIQTNSEWKRLEPFYEDIEAPLTGEPVTLVVLYEQLLKTLPDRKTTKVEAKIHKVSVEEKIEELAKLLERLDFALFQGFYKQFASRYELVVYILAVLEMVRWNRLKVYQQSMFGPIWIYKPNFDASNLPLTRQEKQTLLGDNTVKTDKGGIEHGI